METAHDVPSCSSVWPTMVAPGLGSVRLPKHFRSGAVFDMLGAMCEGVNNSSENRPLYMTYWRIADDNPSLVLAI